MLQLVIGSSSVLRGDDDINTKIVYIAIWSYNTIYWTLSLSSSSEIPRLTRHSFVTIQETDVAIV